MGRSNATQANTDANNQMSAIQSDQVARANKATDTYNKDLSTLKSGGNVGANPFANPTYLANQNLMTAAASSAANQGAKAQIQQQSLRTGSNSAGNRSAFMQLARQKAQTQTDATAGMNQQNYLNNLNYQQWLTGADLAPANVDTSMFGTATSGRDAALGNLTSIQNAQDQMWGNIVGSAMTGAGAGFAHTCWVAAEIFGGWNVLPTRLVREWMLKVLPQTIWGRIFLAFYQRHGKAIAFKVRTSKRWRAALTPVFIGFLHNALDWKGV